MRATTQFSVFLINQPGVLAQVVKAIAVAKVNIVALTIVDSHEHGVLRVVGDEPALLRAALGKLNLPVVETEVLAIELPNRPGALAGAVGSLAEAHVNIEYAYVTAGAPGGKTVGILHVDQQAKAEKALKGHGHKPNKPVTFKNRSDRYR